MPATYDAAYLTTDDGLYSVYFADDTLSWSYLNDAGSLFFYMMPIDSDDKWEIADTISVWSFSSLADSALNEENADFELLGGMNLVVSLVATSFISASLF